MPSKNLLDKYAAWLILAISATFMIGTIWPTFLITGSLKAWDAAGHLLKAHFWSHQILLSGHLSGWFPYWHGGFEIFYMYPPFLSVFLGLLTFIFSPEMALRLTMALSWIIMLPAAFYFFRSFTEDSIAAAAGAGLTVGLKASFSAGFPAIYGVGLIANGFGFAFALFFLGNLKRILLSEQIKLKELLKSGILLALLVQTHVYCTYWVFLHSLVLVGLEIFRRHIRARELLRRYLWVGGVGAFLAAHWLVPFVFNIKWMGSTDTIEKFSRTQIFQRMLFSSLSYSWIVWLLAAVGAVALYRKHRWELAFFISAGALTSLLSLRIINQFLLFGGSVSSGQSIRFEGFFSFLLIGVAAFAFLPLFGYLDARHPRRKAVIFKVAMVLLLLTPYQWAALRHLKAYLTQVDNAATRSLPQLAQLLEEKIQPGEFILSEQKWNLQDAYGTPHFVNQRLPLLAPRVWDLNGNFQEGARSSRETMILAQNLQNPGYLEMNEGYLRSRGVRYIVTMLSASRNTLQTIPWLKQVWTGGEYHDANSDLDYSLALFETTLFESPLGLSRPLNDELAQMSYRTPGIFQVDFKNPVSWEDNTLLAMSYHPWLLAKADGRPIRVKTDSLHCATIGAATDVKSLTIFFKLPLYVLVLRLISFVAFLLVLARLFKPTPRLI